MAWEPRTDAEKFMFKPLNDEQERQFRQHCHENKPELRHWGAYHPVCRDEWTKLGEGPSVS